MRMPLSSTRKTALSSASRSRSPRTSFPTWNRFRTSTGPFRFNPLGAEPVSAPFWFSWLSRLSPLPAPCEIEAEMTISDLFPDQDYRFYMRFERAPVGEFFGRTAAHEKLVSERRHWLQTSPELHSALLPEGEPLLQETVELARFSGTLPDEGARPEAGLTASCAALGVVWEPDFLLLKQGAGGELR